MLGGVFAQLVRALGQLDAATLAAPASVNLRLYHPDVAAQLPAGLYGLVDAEAGDAARCVHAELAQDLLGLVLVDLHLLRDVS